MTIAFVQSWVECVLISWSYSAMLKKKIIFTSLKRRNFTCSAVVVITGSSIGWQNSMFPNGSLTMQSTIKFENDKFFVRKEYLAQNLLHSESLVIHVKISIFYKTIRQIHGISLAVHRVNLKCNSVVYTSWTQLNDDIQ